MISMKIKDLLFTYHARLVNILDFNPEKLSIEKVCAINDVLLYFWNPLILKWEKGISNQRFSLKIFEILH